MELGIAGFDWDDGNRAKAQQHGVSITEIERLFREAEVTVFRDPYPHEERLRAIGLVPQGRYVFVAYTVRERDGGQLIRPISARYMHEKEVRYYYG